jgi:hypothetical protein
MEFKANTQEILDILSAVPNQAAYAGMLGLNRTAEAARAELMWAMNQAFDKPTPWVLNSLRVRYATKSKMLARIAYQDKAKDNSEGGEAARSMLEPHVNSGARRYKAVEVRLYRSNILPAGWNAVPGAGAELDAYGNMRPGQVSQLLNVLGTYTEEGYNKANSKTVDKLKKGNKKKGTYGFEYWINRPGNNSPGKHIPPGIYKRIITGFGTSLKPILIFVKGAKYKQRLDFFGITQRVAERELVSNMREAMELAMTTALLKSQGELL